MVVVMSPEAIQDEVDAVVDLVRLAGGDAFVSRGVPRTIVADVRTETGLPVVTEVIDPAHVDMVASYADMLQVGARSMQKPYIYIESVG
jgi:hypothetical protein